MSELIEASMNFDSHFVEPFLEQVSELVSGFRSGEIAEIAQLVSKLEIDDEHELHFEVTYEGHTVPLQVRIVVDDVDAPDLYFFTTPKLAAAINKLIKDFCEEREI